MGGKPQSQQSKAAKAQRLSVSTPMYHVAPPIETEADLIAATQGLLALDEARLAPLLAQTGPLPLRRRSAGFAGLVSIIVAQQVSVASARAIEARLVAGLVPLAPERLLQASDAELRACGLSAPKIRTLRALSAALSEGRLDLDALAQGPAEAAHHALVQVKGIGPWTADIFLMFCLGHADAFASGDLALQEAARLAFGLAARPDAAALHALAESWRPYRAVAARLLWAYYKICKDRAGMGLAD